MHGAAHLYNRVRGVHTSILGNTERLLICAEDVVRHNTIDKIAGPVGEALIMTADGLAVAIPAVLGYNVFGRLIGRIAGPSLLMQAAAPLALAFVAERLSDPAALALAAAFTVIALACFAAIRRPGA